MPQYAYFDSTVPSPSPVLGWYDTDHVTYPNLPAAVNLLTLAPDDTSRFSGTWAVASGALVPYTPPAPVLNLAQQAQLALGTGLTTAITGTMTLTTTFPTDPATQGKIADVVTTINTTGNFPGGLASYPMKDSSGTWRPFNVAQYKAVAAAISSYAAGLVLIIDGNPLRVTVLPPSSVSLTV